MDHTITPGADLANLTKKGGPTPSEVRPTFRDPKKVEAKFHVNFTKIK